MKKTRDIHHFWLFPKKPEFINFLSIFYHFFIIFLNHFPRKQRKMNKNYQKRWKTINNWKKNEKTRDIHHFWLFPKQPRIYQFLINFFIDFFPAAFLCIIFLIIFSSSIFVHNLFNHFFIIFFQQHFCVSFFHFFQQHFWVSFFSFFHFFTAAFSGIIFSSFVRATFAEIMFLPFCGSVNVSLYVCMYVSMYVCRYVCNVV